MRHFWYLDIAKSDATLLHVLENTTLYTSKECCIHSRTFIEGNTFSKYYCIYLLQRDSTVFKKNAPPFYAMCPIQYSFKRVLHPFRDFPYSYRQDSFKVLLHLLKHSVTKKCYMFSKKSPTIHPIVSVFQFIRGLSGKVGGKSKDVGGMSHCSGTQWLKKNFFNLASLDSRFNI